MYLNSTFLLRRDGSAQDGPLTILLVEDEPSVRQWLHTELEACGCNLLEATDGREALLIAELHRGPIHIVVTDIVMPRVNGLELVRELQQLRPGLPALFISGFPAPYLQDNLNLSKAAKYLAKPFTIDALLDRILEILTANA